MKRILFKVFALLVGLLLSVVSLEVFLRINPKFGYIYNSFRLEDRDKTQARYFKTHSYRSSVLLGYEHIPNSQNGRINSYGLIGKEYRLKKDKGIFRIILLGDSIAEYRNKW